MTMAGQSVSVPHAPKRLVIPKGLEVAAASDLRVVQGEPDLAGQGDEALLD
ncbi:hypothetical protein D9M70_646330 [compost metagenome]